MNQNLVPLVIATHFDQKKRLLFELESMRLNGMNPHLLGMGLSWRDTFDKVLHLASFIDKSSRMWWQDTQMHPDAGPDDIILVLDGFDVLSYGCSASELLRRFSKMECDVVVGAEVYCSPHRQMSDEGLCAVFDSHKSAEDKFHYPNTGCIVGVAQALHAILSTRLHGESIEDDDQVWFSRLIAETLILGRTSGYSVCLDTQGHICRTMSHEHLDRQAIQMAKRSWLLHKEWTVSQVLTSEVQDACFLHFNGAWFNKMYMEDTFASRFSGNASQELLDSANFTRKLLRGMELEAARMEIQTPGWHVQHFGYIKKAPVNMY